ncbi:hypothetical protein FHR92_003068 [Fontibacillus solani]|uniref:Uncharacterized protein n=1 Tax=Fontibacillus solani TaxID=1572857 RepID=A0A7W3SV76_9BACL|nr:hypothetical protein [Fontibacillus solani]
MNQAIEVTINVFCANFFGFLLEKNDYKLIQYSLQYWRLMDVTENNVANVVF